LFVFAADLLRPTARKSAPSTALQEPHARRIRVTPSDALLAFLAGL
jgi:hypothetical protein